VSFRPVKTKNRPLTLCHRGVNRRIFRKKAVVNRQEEEKEKTASSEQTF